MIEQRPHRQPNEFVVLSPNDIVVPDALRKVDEGTVRRIIGSFRVNGNKIVQPLLVDRNHVLVDGAHRLAAAERKGWATVPVVVDYAIETKLDRDLQRLIVNNVRHTMNPLDAAREYKATLAPILRAERQAAKENLSAATTNGPGLQVSGLPAAEGGQPRTVAPSAAGLSQSKINEAYQLQAWASGETAPPKVRKAAVAAIARVRRTPGALHQMFLSVASLQKLIAGQVETGGRSEREQ
jgi:ParB-like chromosome segregation protein Spo0J